MTEAAAKGAAGKKDRAASVGPAEYRFFPGMQGGPGGFQFIGASAVAGGSGPICPAHTRTEDTMLID